MPGPTHQNLVLLFRNHIHLIFELAHAAGMPVHSHYAEIRELQTKIDDPLLPGNILQIDIAVAAYDADGDRAQAGIVLEIQIDEDPNKQWSMVLHSDGPHAVASATAAIQSLLRISPHHFGRYIQLIAASLTRDVMHQVREQLPRQDRQTLSEWERRSSTFSLGLEEGLEQGLHTAILTVLAARGFDVDEPTRARILACDQTDQLETLAGRAATVASLTELFA